MKNLFKLLVFLPVIALSSCANLGQKVDDKFATEYMVKMEAEGEVKNVYFKGSVVGDQGKGENKKHTKAEFVAKSNETGDTYFYTKSTEGDKTSYYEVYTVVNATYEEVTWIKYSDEGKEETLVYAKKDNENYSSQTSNYKMNAALAPALIFSALESPTGAPELLDEDDDYMTVTYYSTGEKNLSVKAVIDMPKEERAKAEQEDPTEEFKVSGTLTSTYDNYRFKTMSENVTTNFGNKQTIKGSASYSKQTISLPSGWEQLLAK